MSKALIGERPWADMTGGAACATAVCSEAALADRSDEVDSEESIEAARERPSLPDLAGEQQHRSATQTLRSAPENPVTKDKAASHRYGLPAGFVSRLGRYGRSVLLEDNVYRLSNGIEFIRNLLLGRLVLATTDMPY